MSDATETKVSHNPLPAKERTKLPRQRVPEQEAQVRAHNFQEVNLGFPPEQARQESLRCIECPKPGCVLKCPVSVDVRAVIDPRGLLGELGLELAADVEVRVWDSTAEIRYLVLPERPEGTEHLDEAALAALVTRDSMVGVARVAATAGAHA